MKHIYRVRALTNGRTLGDFDTFEGSLRETLSENSIIECYDVIAKRVDWRAHYTREYVLACDNYHNMMVEDLVTLINHNCNPSLDCLMELLKCAVQEGFVLHGDWILSEEFENGELFKTAARYLGYNLKLMRRA